MHKPYLEIRGHPADFRVKYRFYSKEEGGRQTTLPHQGYRCDFWYEHLEHKEDTLFMIHPEFEDEDRKVILHDDRPVYKEGTALMWILFSQMRPYHIQHLKIGTKGFFMEGLKRVAECTVLEILSMYTNPS